MRARLPAVPAAERPVLLTGATLIDGTGADPVRDAEVEIRDGRLVYVGPSRPQRASDVDVVDLDGRHLLPGFIDTHVHLVMSTQDSAEAQRLWFPEEAVIVTLDNLRKTLDAGVTTARDLSGLTPGYRSSITAGRAVGPRLHLAIAMLSPTGGHADPVHANGSLPVWGERGLAAGCAVVDTDEEVVKAVRTLVRTGADVIKVCTSGGVTSPHDDPADAGLPESQVGLIVSEMRKRQGQPVAAHAQNDSGVRAAVRGGAASVEHGYDLSDETIDDMLERGTVLVPTLSALLREVAGDPQRVAARAALRARATDSIRRAIAAGVPVALGTDAGIVAHGGNLLELAHLVDHGVSPIDAISAGTLGGAKLLRLESDLGSIEVGKLADLVVIDVDPIADIAALADASRVRAVIQGGRFVKDLDRIAEISRAPHPPLGG